ncbi:flavin reductase family protein [Xanthobacter sp. KR7-65]|uniref:flavin reductase family protein n=1 Tax=Xanthobacter sp. KR7-65 TaxID=3156612 RepID=UPI0032B61F77
MTTIDLDARLDPRELRNALGRFATGIAVVMAKDEQGPIGVTVNSFSSVSLDPPLILFCMARTLNSLERLEKATAYSVNILLGSQKDISNRFARAGEDKFADVAWTDGRLGAPLLTPAHAVFECVPYAHYDGGDHVIFVGRVVHMHAEGEDDPLLYYRGSYRLLAMLENS